MVSVRNLTKQYGPQYAVDDLSFEVHEGEVLGFLGPNGAGKSTTMKSITGFITPTSGSISVDGYDVQAQPIEVRRRIGYLPEHNPLYLDMYVREFLRFAGRIYGYRGAELHRRVGEVVERTGLHPEQHKKIGALSKGYRQRVGLCQALIHDPAVLILDEPTSGLDPNQVMDIRSLIQEVGKNKTVIFSSHILSEVEAVASRVLIINRGKLVADTPRDRLRDLATDGVRISIELERPGFDAEAVRAITGVREVTLTDETHAEIVCAPDTDIRADIFRLCVARQWVLLGMSLHAFTLEEAFRQLTRTAATTTPQPPDTDSAGM
ncbi:MAG: hypothetical protein OHK0039_12120 [Bacteroidia bacterium]